MKLKMRRSP